MPNLYETIALLDERDPAPSPPLSEEEMALLERIARQISTEIAVAAAVLRSQ